MSWISPRIWRSSESKFNEDEPLNSVGVYTPEVLQAICDQGFDTIWMRGRLWDLIRSEIYPELNDRQCNRKNCEFTKGNRGWQRKGGKSFSLFQ